MVIEDEYGSWGWRGGANKLYYKNGKLKAEYPYDREGRVNGLARGYHESGAPAWEQEYVNGEPQGKQKNFPPSGKSGKKK